MSQWHHVYLFSLLTPDTSVGSDMSDVVYVVLQCDWFFSSWDEDVNVPVDEVPSEPVPISGMSEQLLAKAESLGEPSF